MILNEEDEADTVYLLAKELAYDVVTGQTDNLAAALAKTSGKDIVQFANALGISHSSIGEKVCKTKQSANGSYYGTYAGEYENSSARTRTKCGAKGDDTQGKQGSKPQALSDFAAKTILGHESKNWPTSRDAEKKDNDNANAVAKDLVQELNRDEKTIVAGLLAKTIEGGEVVEIRAVSSTSVIVSLRFNYLKI